MMFEVEIQVAGAVNQSWIAAALPLFEAEPAPQVTMFRGVLGPGENLVSIVELLRRHGLTLVDVWVDQGATTRT